MRFGFTLPNNWGIDDVDAVAHLAVEAEDAGFDSVWVNHHVLNVGYVGERLGSKPYYDALTVLTWVASRTNSVRLGTSVLVLPYLNPLGLAKQVATLDLLSGGRVDLGVGVGGLAEEHAAVSPHLPFDQRGRWTDEALAVMVGLWTEEEPSAAGEFFAFDPVRAAPKPLQRPHPPLLIGGNGAVALRRVARFAQGWHPLGLSVDGLNARLAMLDDELAAAGRTRADVRVSLRADISLVDSAEKAKPPFRGTPDQLVGTFAAYRDAGVDELVISVSSPDVSRVRAVLETFAAEVMTPLRAL